MYHPKTNSASTSIYCKTKGSEWEGYNNGATAGKAIFLLLGVCVVKQWAPRFDRANANQAAVLLPEGSSGGGWGVGGGVFVVRLPGQQSVSVQVQTCAAR